MNPECLRRRSNQQMGKDEKSREGLVYPRKGRKGCYVEAWIKASNRLLLLSNSNMKLKF
jgi:hypothetical protein